MEKGKKDNWFSPSICLTHACNLNCVYCYQRHDFENRMTYETAQKAIDWIFDNAPEEAEGITINFLGGEPLLEFNLITLIYEYVKSKYTSKKYKFFASTNGTVMTEEMKKWFKSHLNDFTLGLSLDGSKETHNHNRSNSYDLIDFDFFLENYPNQSVKMTLSQDSLYTLAQDIISIHEKGFRNIAGVNLAEGEFDWSKEEYIVELSSQLAQLENYYLNNPNLPVNQMLDRKLAFCESNELPQKWCGVGTNAQFIDTDGTVYPCPFFTPMTFSREELSKITSFDYAKEEKFIDEDCYKNCYIYSVCPSCSGTCYKKNHSFSERDKSRCRIQKLITLYAADLIAKKLIMDSHYIPEQLVFRTISSIKKIKELYIKEFSFLTDSKSC